ncbi:MAG: glycosyltransferase family 2 protein [Bdellovibrionia bacterium]
MGEIDIIFPCYNPPAGWVDQLVASCARIEELLPGRKINYILVDDGSTKAGGAVGVRGIEELGGRDVLAGEFETLKQRMPRMRIERYEVNRGKGFALRHAVALSQSPLCVFTDVDCPYEESSVAGLCMELEKGPDIVPGLRARDYYERVRFDRVLISKFVRLLLRMAFRLTVTDTQCGLKGFSSRGRELFLQTTIDRYLFDLEFLCLASSTRDIKIVPFTVRLKDNVAMSKFGAFVLMHEGMDFLKIWFRAILRRKPSA